MLNRMLESSRYFIAFAVVACLAGSVTLLIYGAITIGKMIYDVFEDATVSQSYAEHLAVEMVEMVDVFLIASVMYIVALGLQGLFIDRTLDLPPWLQINTIDELKTKMVGIIIVLIGVSFLDNAVTWESGTDIVYFGVAIGIVIVALAVSTYVTHLSGHPPSSANGDENLEANSKDAGNA